MIRSTRGYAADSSCIQVEPASVLPLRRLCGYSRQGLSFIFFSQLRRSSWRVDYSSHDWRNWRGNPDSVMAHGHPSSGCIKRNFAGHTTSPDSPIGLSGKRTLASQLIECTCEAKELSMLDPRKIVLVAFCTVAAFMATLQAQDPGCQFTGNSACGGDNRGQCAPHERLYAEQCSSGPAQSKCFVDNYCASINRGRVNIGGRPWSGGYIFRQLGDSLTVTGGSAGPGSGRFIGPYLISITWNGTPAYTGTISVQNNIANQIQWDRPPLNR